MQIEKREKERDRKIEREREIEEGLEFFFEFYKLLNVSHKDMSVIFSPREIFFLEWQPCHCSLIVSYFMQLKVRLKTNLV